MERRRHRGSKRRGERGIALVLTLFALMALAMMTAGALLVGSSGIRATRNYRGAAQVHFASESAISQAMQVINGPGVINFQNDVVAAWPTLFGNAARQFGPLSGFSYTVAVTASAADPANAGRLVATALGTEGVRNLTVANVVRSNLPSTSPGAIYLANDSPTNAAFNGNAFQVDGTDKNLDGTAGPNPPVPGISTRNDTNTQEVINSLNSNQQSDVTGVGFSPGPPVVPSVKTSPAAPSATQLNQLINDLLARPNTAYPNNNYAGHSTFGTDAAPQISHFTSTNGVTLNGNADGAGIMIVEGDLTVQGSFRFDGLILVRGRTNVIQTTTGIGNATVYGSIWTADINLVVGGSALTQYSSQGLALANSVAGGGALPAPIKVTWLADCGQAPGVAGCP